MSGLWAAQPRQNEFLVNHAAVYEGFYGGAAGGGKTDTLLIYQASRRMAYPGSKGLFLRRRFTDLKQPGAALDRFLELFGGMVSYNANDHKATWPNGSVTQFGYMDSDADRLQYQGAQFDDVTFDELTQFTELQYKYLFSRVRVTNQVNADLGMRGQVRAAGNPGGIGHAWVKARFVDVCRDSVFVDPEIFIEQPDGTRFYPDRVFVPASVDDNIALMQSDPQYKLGLMMLPEAERRALLDGDWDIFDGQFFSEWRREVHLADPLMPPAHWRRFIGFDWGWSAPWVALFGAQNPDTRQVFVYRELSGTKMHDSEIARTIMEASRGERIEAMYADPSIWSKKNMTSTAEIMQSVPGWHIRMEPANNDRAEGWRRVHEYLAWQPDGSGGIGQSPLLVIGRNCVGLTRTLPTQIHDQIKVEDLDSDGEDHWVDALRYMLVARPVVTLGGGRLKSVVLLPR